MSHIAKVQVEFRDLDLLKKICDRKNIPIEIAPPGKTIKRCIYNSEVSGVAALRLPSWRYDIVVSFSQEHGTSQLYMDNYKGYWGNIDELHKLQQDYSHELVVDRYSQQGYRLDSEKVMEDGTIKLTMVN